MSTPARPVAGADLRKPMSLLSLDAGGPQGISQLLILKEVMERLSKDEIANSQGIVKRPCDVFDMIGGVGTGGLIAIFLVVLKMTAKDALEEFSNFVVEVFKDVSSDPQQQTERLTTTIDAMLNRHRIVKDAELIPTARPASRCKLVVPIMYKNHVGSPCVLRNYVSSHEPSVDLSIAEAMLATCSTPPIFTPMTISKDYATFEYVGGDLGLSNPTREIIAEAHRTFGHETTVSCLLSIGCGRPGVNNVPSNPAGTAWTDFVERVLMDSEKTAQDIEAHMSKLSLYHRLSVNYGLERNQSREWKDPESIGAHTTIYLNDLDIVGRVDRCVDAIEHGDGFTTLERLRHAGGAKVISPPLPPLTPTYVERKAPMEFIEKALFEKDGRIKSGSKRIVVTGIGGCGKTQLIRYLINKYKHLFESTFFVDGSSPATIRRDIVRHVRALGGAHSQRSFKESMIFLSQALDSGERLLVIDNVDEPTLDLSHFLPRWENGTVIVTSRSHARGQLNPASHLRLDVMTVDESVKLLLRGSGQPRPATESDRILAMAVGCHPIALVQAVSYMYNTGCPPSNYVTLLRSNRDRLLRDHPATSQVDMRYKTAFAAFDASYSILPQKAQSLWHLLSFFQSQRFPIELITLAASDGFSHERHPFLGRGEEFELGKEYLKEIFYDSGQCDALKLDSILGTLRSHSLITRVSAGNTTLLHMHPLVHEWGRLRISEGSHHQIEAAAVRLLCCGAREENYSMMQYLSSHVEGLCSAPEHLHSNDVASLALILERSGMYDKAATLNSLVHGMVKRELGPNHLMTVKASANLANTYCALGRYAEAEVLEREVLRQRQQALGAGHPDTIRASSGLATTYRELGRYAEAEELYKQVLSQRKQVLGVDHPDTIRASSHLAVTYRVLGRYAEMEKLDVEVLKRRKQLLGVDHPDTIKASAGLAETYHELGRHVEAEELRKEVLERREQALGVNHPHTISASDHLAATYHALGRYDAAEELKRRVLQQRERVLGVDHPDTVRASAELAVTCYALGRYGEAEELHTKVLKNRTAIQGERHPNTIKSMFYLAQTYYATQRQSEASSLAQKSHQIALETLGDAHPLSQEIFEFVESLPKRKPARTSRRILFALDLFALFKQRGPRK